MWVICVLICVISVMLTDETEACEVMNYHFSRGCGRASCCDRKWRKMWEGWRRVPPALTSVSVTLSRSRPNESQLREESPSGDLAIQSLLHALVRHRVRTDESDMEVKCYFNDASLDARLWNNYSSVTPTRRSLRGQKSHSHHPDMVSSHRPPTCPQPAKSFCFPSRRPFYLIPWLQTILDPTARPCGQRSQAPEELELQTEAMYRVVKCSNPKDNRK